MTTPNDVYDNPLIGRYASKAMSERWGPLRKFRTWRRLWLWLAEAESELGMTADDGVSPRIKPEQLAELRAHLDDIDFDRAAMWEKKKRHDVMAHVETLAEVAPKARDIIHLGATSCFVTDNTDIILMRESLHQLCETLAAVIDSLGKFADTWKDEPTLGFTHFQPAQLTTVGKRACLWLFDLTLDLQEIERRRDELPFRGAKGTTGTQASFLALFHGDHKKVKKLDRLVSQKAGFSRVVPVCGQTYTRKLDTQVLDALGGLARRRYTSGAPICDCSPTARKLTSRSRRNKSAHRRWRTSRTRCEPSVCVRSRATSWGSPRWPPTRPQPSGSSELWMTARAGGCICLKRSSLPTRGYGSRSISQMGWW